MYVYTYVACTSVSIWLIFLQVFIPRKGKMRFQKKLGNIKIYTGNECLVNASGKVLPSLDEYYER